LTVKSMYLLFVSHDLEVYCSSSVLMNVNVKAPIHAATAMLTATVTAISMIAATTGLRAFLLLHIFHIFCTIPPLGVHVEHSAARRFKSYVLRHHINLHPLGAYIRERRKRI